MPLHGADILPLLCLSAFVVLFSSTCFQSTKEITTLGFATSFWNFNDASSNNSVASASNRSSANDASSNNSVASASNRSSATAARPLTFNNPLGTLDIGVSNYQMYIALVISFLVVAHANMSMLQRLQSDLPPRSIWSCRLPLFHLFHAKYTIRSVLQTLGFLKPTSKKIIIDTTNEDEMRACTVSSSINFMDLTDAAVLFTYKDQSLYRSIHFSIAILIFTTAGMLPVTFGFVMVNLVLLSRYLLHPVYDAYTVLSFYNKHAKGHNKKLAAHRVFKKKSNGFELVYDAQKLNRDLAPSLADLLLGDDAIVLHIQRESLKITINGQIVPMSETDRLSSHMKKKVKVPIVDEAPLFILNAGWTAKRARLDSRKKKKEVVEHASVDGVETRHQQRVRQSNRFKNQTNSKGTQKEKKVGRVPSTVPRRNRKQGSGQRSKAQSKVQSKFHGKTRKRNTKNKN